MTEGEVPFKEFNFYKGKSFILMVVSLFVLLISYFILVHKGHNMPVARFAKWSAIFAIFMNSIVLSISIAGPKNIVSFYKDGFDIRFAQLSKLLHFENSDLLKVEENKNVLTLTFRNSEKKNLLGLMFVDPQKREELKDIFYGIAEKNQKD